ASWLPGTMTSDSHSILSRYVLACAYSGLKPNVVRSPEQTTRSGRMSLISLIARSSSVGTKYGPPQCRSEMWAIVNDPFDPAAMAEVYGPSTGGDGRFPPWVPRRLRVRKWRRTATGARAGQAAGRGCR